MSKNDPFDQISKCIKRGDVLGVRALVTSGAPVDSRNRFGWTPLMLAAEAVSRSKKDRYFFNTERPGRRAESEIDGANWSNTNPQQGLHGRWTV